MADLTALQAELEATQLEIEVARQAKIDENKARLAQLQAE
jgi:hypothetical protein